MRAVIDSPAPAQAEFVLGRSLSQPLPRGALSDLVRRWLDISIALIALAMLAPLLAAVALAVRLSSPGPALFRQVRVGKAGKQFAILKFRTMTVGSDDSQHRQFVEKQIRGICDPLDGGFKLPADPRITPVGRILRRYSIDELPQFINVLQGSMSLVGPRPATPWERQLFPESHLARESVRPGITGLWQVSGRSLLSAREMLDLDVQYVSTRSLRADFRILARTPLVLMRGDGAR